MLSVVIPTRDSERALIPTLAMLIPGVMASAVREVIVADGGSTDGTREVVDVTGCTIISSTASLGLRLRQAADAARADWLLFLRPGAVLETGWIAEIIAFCETAAADDIAGQAAVFRHALPTRRRRSAAREFFALVHGVLAAPDADHGLLVSRALYQRLGGHGDEHDTENRFIRRLGGRRIARLHIGISRAAGTEAH